jgi:hypothetical protein
MFHNQTIQQLGNNQMGGTGSAVMHLFSPRAFSNQGKRPVAYKFDGNFLDRAVDAVSHKATSQGGGRINALISDPRMMGSIIPTITPDHMLNMEHMANFWTFMLIVNNDKTGPGGLVRQMADNLKLYYGFFLEEPCNAIMHMGRLTINPNAKMVVTHATVVNKTSHVNAWGTGQRWDSMADIDIIPSQMMGHMSDKPTTSMRPEDLFQNVFTDPMSGQVGIMHDESKLLTNMGSSLDINSRLSVPKNNIKKVLDAVADSTMSMQASQFDGPMIDLGTDTFTDLLGMNLRDGASAHDIGLPTNVVLTLEHVVQRYRPTFNRIDLPHHPQYLAGDQSIGSARNVFCSMLASVLPAIMADFILAQIGFRYNSHMDAMQIDGVAPITPLPQEELKKRVEAFIFRLKSEIFPILKHQHGDFELSINCDCTSVTHINLNFFADSVASPEIFEVPTLLGGFNNPLIGSVGMADYNSTELGAFVDILHGNDRDVPLGAHDMSAQTRGLIAYDGGAAGQGPRIDFNIHDNNATPSGGWRV